MCQQCRESTGFLIELHGRGQIYKALPAAFPILSIKQRAAAVHARLFNLGSRFHAFRFSFNSTNTEKERKEKRKKEREKGGKVDPPKQIHSFQAEIRPVSRPGKLTAHRTGRTRNFLSIHLILTELDKDPPFTLLIKIRQIGPPLHLLNSSSSRS